MTDLQALNLRVAVLRIRRDQLNATYEAARGEAEREYAALRRAGTSQQKVILPGGNEAGTISIQSGGKRVDVDEDRLLGFVEANQPEEIEDYLTPAALTDPEVLALIKMMFPNLVGRRVKAAHRKALIEELEDTDGTLIDQASGERVEIATVTNLSASGQFSYRPGRKGTEAVLRLLDAGVITPDGEIAGHPPAAPETPPAAEADEPGENPIRRGLLRILDREDREEGAA